MIQFQFQFWSLKTCEISREKSKTEMYIYKHTKKHHNTHKCTHLNIYVHQYVIDIYIYIYIYIYTVRDDPHITD